MYFVGHWVWLTSLFFFYFVFNPVGKVGATFRFVPKLEGNSSCTLPRISTAFIVACTMCDDLRWLTRFFFVLSQNSSFNELFRGFDFHVVELKWVESKDVLQAISCLTDSGWISFCGNDGFEVNTSVINFDPRAVFNEKEYLILEKMAKEFKKQIKKSWRTGLN